MTKPSLLSLLLLIFALPNGKAYENSSLSITSPQDGTKVQPGSIVNVVVEAQAGLSIESVIVSGDGPINPAGATGSSPFKLILQIPQNIAAGIYHLTALGVMGPGKGVYSAPISIIVDEGDQISAIQADPRGLRFRFPGEMLGLRVIGTRSNGSLAFLTNSSKIAYSSANPEIASIDSEGHAIGRSAGKTTIIISYFNQTVRVSASIPKLIPGDLNGDGVVDKWDLAILQRYLNTRATCPTDARDLNHDGKIDALDARILVTLFTNPRGQQ
jgi:Dockerin type I domain/Bacterial Ig domain